MPLLLTVVVAIALSVAYAVSVVFSPGLRSIPGPWLAKLTNLYRVRLIRRGTYSWDIAALHGKYGPYVRTGPDCVSISDRRLADEIYGLKRGNDFPKSDWVKSSQTVFKAKPVPALMTTQDQEYHSLLKRSIASAYSVTTLMGYEASVEEVVNHFIRRMDELFASTGASCPIHLWLQWYAYDVIGAITVSRPLGFLEQGQDIDGMLGEIQAESRYRATAAVMPILDWICRKNIIARNITTPTHTIMLRARELLQERLQQLNSPESGARDFISRFLEAKDKHPDLLNDRNMLGFVGSNLQAGSDTTAITLRTILYNLLRQPEILKKMRKEIEESGFKYPIPFQQAFNDLPYTSAVIQEGLRILPPFALQLERVVPPGPGLQLPDGPVLRPGTKVGMFGYSMHFDKEIYGDDAEDFNPDRWLPKDGEEQEDFQERHKQMKALEMSFGKGIRRCAGVHVAELQLYKFVPAVVSLLDFELVHPDREWAVEQMFFALQKDMDVRVRRREPAFSSVHA